MNNPNGHQNRSRTRVDLGGGESVRFPLPRFLGLGRDIVIPTPPWPRPPPVVDHFLHDIRQNLLEYLTFEPASEASASAPGAFSSVVAASPQSNLPRYDMTNETSGICLIISNNQFKKSHDLKGYLVDKGKLANTFRKLKFQVVCHENLGHDRIMAEIKKAAEMDHTFFDCFVCCILSHGHLGNVHGSDDVPVLITDITEMFRARHVINGKTYWSSLAGKPKLFFIQACQTYDQSTDAANSANVMRNMIPNESDFLVAYAAAPGNVSWVHRDEGSWYIQRLTELLDRFALTGIHLLDTLTVVNEEVGKFEPPPGYTTQTAAVWHTLQKQVMFEGFVDEVVPLRHEEMKAFNPLRVKPRQIFRQVCSKLRPYITSLVVTEGKIVMSDWKNEDVKVMKTDMLKDCRSVKLDAKPHSLAVLHDKVLAVTSENANAIHFIDVNELSVLKTTQTERRYWGVGCGGQSGNLIVSCRRYDAQPATVDEITRNGQLQRTIVDSNNLPSLREPSYLYVVQNEVFLTDAAACCLFRVSLSSGKLLATHCDSRLRKPRQVSADSSGNVYIASLGGRCVLVVGTDGQHHLLLDGRVHSRGGFDVPHCITVTEDGVVVGWSSFGIRFVLSGFSL